MAQIIERVQRPTLILAHNKTLAAQLYSEFREFFPNNAVEYFVSYYDYYQPEAYIARTDTYIEKDSSINDEIDRLRLAATASLFSRRDVVIVASVSAIYGLGSPQDYGQEVVHLKVGDQVRRNHVLRRLVDIYYERNDQVLQRGRFRVRGDTLEVQPAYGETAFRVELWGDEVERISEIDTLTGEVLDQPSAGQHLPGQALRHALRQAGRGHRGDRGRAGGAHRLVQGQRQAAGGPAHRAAHPLRPGDAARGRPLLRHRELQPAAGPPCARLPALDAAGLLPARLAVHHRREPHDRAADPRHVQRRPARKQVLVDYGFRLPLAMDNRPLRFEEFEAMVTQAIYTSATPGPYEREVSAQIVDQVIRPTGLLDPVVEVRPVKGQVDDLVKEIRQRLRNGQRVLVTTLTKRMAEDLADYLAELGIKVHYLHSEIHTLERIEILRDLRLGVYDVVVGINLLREGLDLPEVSLVAILDADKEGFLRSGSSLIQTIGRAARHVEGKAILYADQITDSMRFAIDETNRRREKQGLHNEEHGIVPQSIVKSVRDLTQRLQLSVAEDKVAYSVGGDGDGGRPAPPLSALPRAERLRIIRDLEKEMHKSAEDLRFEEAAILRDQIVELRRSLQEELDLPAWKKDVLDEDELVYEISREAA